MFIEGSDLDKENKRLLAERDRCEKELDKVIKKMNFLEKISKNLTKYMDELKSEGGPITKMENAKSLFENGGYLDDEGTFDKGILAGLINRLTNVNESLRVNQSKLYSELLILEDERINRQSDFYIADLKYKNFINNLQE